MARPKDPKNRNRRTTAILEAAATLFATKGLQDTTMQDICKAAGISAGGLYRYFSGKDAIIQALAQHERDSIDDMIRMIEAGSSLLQTLDLLLADLVAYQTDPIISRLSIEFVIYAHNTPERFETLLSSERNLSAAMVQAVRKDQAANRLPGDLCPDSTVYALLALFDGMITQAAFAKSSKPPALTETVRRMVHIYLAPPPKGKHDD
jgi:TetR/AcrR family transcriptional regulator, repressor for uid operon